MIERNNNNKKKTNQYTWYKIMAMNVEFSAEIQYWNIQSETLLIMVAMFEFCNILEGEKWNLI